MVGGGFAIISDLQSQISLHVFRGRLGIGLDLTARFVLVEHDGQLGPSQLLPRYIHNAVAFHGADFR